MAASGLVRHLRNYASAGVISAAIGVISFPILTRNLSVEDYGLLGLVTASLTLFVAFGKLGVQQSVIRFFAPASLGTGPWSRSELDSTALSTFAALGALATALWLVAGTEVFPRFLRAEGLDRLFVAGAGVVLVRVVGSGVINFLRAEQRSGDVARAQMLGRALTVSLVVAFVLVDEISPLRYVASLLVADLAAMGYALLRYRDRLEFSFARVRAPLARALLAYGAPLMLLESLGLVLRLSDRYLIEAMLGIEALGQYAASYNLVAYLEVIVLAALVQAVRPMYVQIHEGEGEGATRAFLARGLHVYLALGLPFVAVFSLVAPHALVALAGDAYAAGTVVIPWVTASFLIEGTVQFLAAGLYLSRNTRALMLWSAIAAGLNLALNVLLIPRFGLVGAASVTIVSYAVFVAGVGHAAFRHVAFPLPRAVPAAMALASLATFAALARLDLGGDVVDGLAKGALATLALGAALLAIDPSVRGPAAALVARVGGARLGRGGVA